VSQFASAIPVHTFAPALPADSACVGTPIPGIHCCEEAEILTNLVHLSQEFADILRARNSRDDYFVVSIEGESPRFSKENVDDGSGCHIGQCMSVDGISTSANFHRVRSPAAAIDATLVSALKQRPNRIR
jgi:hypothetical protein